MRLFTWRGAVPDADVAAARAAAGAAYLDNRLGAGWEQVIDAERLDIASPLRCVLAQVGWAGHWLLLSPWRAVQCGFSCGLLADCLSLVYRPEPLRRSYELLNAAWKALLAERRQRREEREALARRAASRCAEAEAPASVAGNEGAPSRRRAPVRVRRRRSRHLVPCG
jgi:hypothetical protein